MKTKWLCKNALIYFFVIIGVVLMSLTVKYRINPAEGSVVDPAVSGTMLHVFLFITTMPAWIAGVTVGNYLFGNIYELSIIWMTLFQILFYYLLANVAVYLYTVVHRRAHKNDNPI